jgi:hypothetical protein
MPRPCHTTTMTFWKKLLKATAQRGMDTASAWHGMRELASAVQRRRVGDLPLSASPGHHAEFHDGYQKHTNPLNCKTSSSDTSGYHADFHKGYGIVGQWQGRGMVCVNYRGTAWARHGTGELALSFIPVGQVGPQWETCLMSLSWL